MIEKVNIKTIRRLIANYMGSEGCSCCRDYEQHDIDKKKIAKLLKVPMYDDKSGYDFSLFRDKNNL